MRHSYPIGTGVGKTIPGKIYFLKPVLQRKWKGNLMCGQCGPEEEADRQGLL